MNSRDSGKVPFTAMIVVIVFLFAVCIVCPLAIADWAKHPVALPLMSIALLLPFVHFFIFGGAELARGKRMKKNDGGKE